MGRERPGRWMGGDAATGFEDVAGDGELVGGCADVAKRVVQDEVLEMDEFAIDPERGVRVEASRHESVGSVRLLRTYGDHAARIDVSRRNGLRSTPSVGVQM